MADNIYGIVKKSDLVNIADAIRDKTGIHSSIKVSSMASLVGEIGNGKFVTDLWHNRLSGIIGDSTLTYIPRLSNNTGITEISFPEAVVCQDSSVLLSCFSLSKVYAPKLEAITPNAFLECDLREANFPRVSSIGAGAFTNNRNLSLISFSEYYDFNMGTFNNCDLREFSYYNPIRTSIMATGAFAGNSNLSIVSLPFISAIGDTMFYGCRSLSNLDAPNLMYVSSGALQNCRVSALPALNSVWSWGLVGNGIVNLDGFPNISWLGSSALGANNIEIVSHKRLTGIQATNYSPIEAFGGSPVKEYNLPNFQGALYLYYNSRVTKVFTPMGNYRFSSYNCSRCENLTEFTCYSLGGRTDYIFDYCSNLIKVNILNCNQGSFSSAYWFRSTPIADSTILGQYGSIYFPSKVLDRMKTVSGWSYFSSRLTALDSSWDEKYYYAYEYSGSTTLTSIENLKPSAEFILPYAFSGCTGLTTLSHSNVKYMAQTAFSGCNNITQINLPQLEGLPYPLNSYMGVTNITSINLEGLTYLYEWAFSGCYRLTSLSIPNVSFIARNAFTNCNSLVFLDLPNVEHIVGDSMFYWCNNLKTINAPKLKTMFIRESGFDNCNSLEEFNAPELEYADYIGYYAGKLSNLNLPKLKYCPGMRLNTSSVVSLPNLEIGYVANSMLGEELYAPKLSIRRIGEPEASRDRYNIGYNFKKYTVGVERLVSYAFGSGYTEWLSLSKVVSAWTQALWSYSKLEFINISRLTSFPNGLFRDCYALSTIVCPSLRYVADNAFYRCFNLSDVNLENVEYIGSSAFYQCGSLTTLSTITSYIGSYAMQNCYTLVSIYLNYPGVVQLGENALLNTPFDGNSAFTTSEPKLYVPSSLYETYASDSMWGVFSSYMHSM